MSRNSHPNFDLNQFLQTLLAQNPDLARQYSSLANHILTQSNANSGNQSVLYSSNQNCVNIQNKNIPNQVSSTVQNQINPKLITPNQTYINVPPKNIITPNKTAPQVHNQLTPKVRTKTPYPNSIHLPNQYINPNPNILTSYQPNQNYNYFENGRNQHQLGQKQNPIIIDSDDDDDDVVILEQKPKRKPTVLPPPLPTRIISLGNFNVEIPVFSDDFIIALDKALEISPTINLSRVSSFLNKAVQMEKVDNLVKRIIMAGNDEYTEANPSFRNDLEKIVVNCYPRLYTQDLRAILKKNSFDLTNTIEDIPKHRNLRLNRSRAVTQPLIRIFDLVASIQAIKYSNYLNEQIEKANKERLFKIAQAKHELVECECCCNEVLFEDMAQCPDGHLFCKQCLNHDVQQLLGEGRTEVRCLSISGCDKIVPDAELERCVEKKILKNFFIIESQNAVQMANLPGLVKCYQCGFEATVDDSQIFHCPECGEDTCPGCGLPAHPGFSCEAYKNIDPDRLAEEKMSDAVIRTCPKCNSQFLKEEGCNKMECPKCHTFICYWCGKEIPKEVGYDHFWRQKGQCPPDKCPLWVQDEGKLQEAEIDEAQNHD